MTVQNERSLTASPGRKRAKRAIAQGLEAAQ
jgi:hypothetical protein